MKISGKDEISRYVNQTVLSKTEKPARKVSTAASASQKSEGGTTVSLSQKAKQVQKVHETIQSEPDIRSQRVSAIKDNIKNGTYKIDYDKIAEKILEAFSEEIV